MLEREVADRAAIADLHARYGDLVSRRAWDEVPMLFTPDCRLRLDLRDGRTIERTGRDDIVEFVSAGVERFEFFLFTILNAVVDVDADGAGASGRLYLREFRQDPDELWTTAFGLYEDRYRRDGAVWRFADRSYMSLARTAPSAIGAETFDIPGSPDDHRT